MLTLLMFNALLKVVAGDAKDLLQVFHGFSSWYVSKSWEH